MFVVYTKLQPFLIVVFALPLLSIGYVTASRIEKVLKVCGDGGITIHVGYLRGFPCEGFHCAMEVHTIADNVIVVGKEPHARFVPRGSVQHISVEDGAVYSTYVVVTVFFVQHYVNVMLELRCCIFVRVGLRCRHTENVCIHVGAIQIGECFNTKVFDVNDVIVCRLFAILDEYECKLVFACFVVLEDVRLRGVPLVGVVAGEVFDNYAVQHNVEIVRLRFATYLVIKGEYVVCFYVDIDVQNSVGVVDISVGCVEVLLVFANCPRPVVFVVIRFACNYALFLVTEGEILRRCSGEDVCQLVNVRKRNVGFHFFLLGGIFVAFLFVCAAHDGGNVIVADKLVKLNGEGAHRRHRADFIENNDAVTVNHHRVGDTAYAKHRGKVTASCRRHVEGVVGVVCLEVCNGVLCIRRTDCKHGYAILISKRRIVHGRELRKARVAPRRPEV